MHAHEGILALVADKASFLSAKGAPMRMLADAGGKLEPLSQGWPIKVAIKIDPFPAMIAPGLPSKGFFEAPRQDFLLQRAQMFTDHDPILCLPTQKLQSLCCDVFHRQPIF